MIGAVFGLAARLSRPLLPVHDIATDYDEQWLPQYIDDRRPGGPQLVFIVKMMYGDVQPLFVDSSDAVSVYAAALDAAKAMGWRITAEDAPTRLQALAETSLMKFKDDVVVTIKTVEGGTKMRIDTRSRSRMGQGDIGANGARILAYQKKLRDLLGDKGLALAAASKL